MQIRHHGAVSGVTGSCHELVFNRDESVLVDCGLFQGADARDLDPEAPLIDFPVDTARALVITHCHIDHCGRIPWLIGAGFEGPIYASRATARLLPLVLEDAIKVGITRDEDLVRRVLERLEKQLVAVDYDAWCRLEPIMGEAVSIRFRRAGHILGSAYVEVNVGESRKGERIVFSGDLGPPHTPLLPAPRPPYRADVLVIESTYGDRLHEGRKARRKALQKVIERSYENGGTVLIPAFSIGRTQEILYEIEEIIHRHQRKGKPGPLDWDAVDVVLDSPLAASFTKVYREMRELWDAEAESGKPAIVIAASGMCAGGRIVNYLKALLPDPRTDVLFVGYQAEGTPGRDILEYGPGGGYVMLDRERVPIKAAIHEMSGYSAHADQADLLRFVKRIRSKPREIRVVHGESEAKRVFAERLREVCPEAEVLIPVS